MEETIIILREQTILCLQLLKLFADLTETLRKNSMDMLQVVRKIEPLIMELSKNAIRAQTFLQRKNFDNFKDFLNAQESGAKRDVAERLLKQSNNLQSQLKRRTNELNRLTANGKAFVEFNLNILSRTSVNTTYGAAAVTGSQAGRRVFDANV